MAASDLITIPNNSVRENSLVMVLAFRPGVSGSNPVESYISATHLFICFFDTDCVRLSMVASLNSFYKT